MKLKDYSDLIFVVICNDNGLIKRVIRNEAAILGEYPEGKLFFSLLDPASRNICLDFFKVTKEKGINSRVNLNFPIGSESYSLSCTGVVAGDEIYIHGSGEKDDTELVISQLYEIINDQANVIRKITREQYNIEKATAEEDNLIYNEITSLNNELITLQRELAKKNAELERLNTMKNRFLGMAAHDLRSPLGIICSYTDFLLEEAGEALTLQQKEFLDIILGSAQFMLRLIDDLLDLTKIESGKIDLHLERIDLIEYLGRIAGLNNVLAKKKGISVILESSERVSVICDPVKMEQVFNNLISNAVKFSFRNSEVRLRIIKGDQEIIVEVEDNGQGIPADELDRLFIPFERTSTKSTGGEKSTGLGLSISKRIVESHGGRIDVRSEFGRGTVFSVVLPLADRQGGLIS